MRVGVLIKYRGATPKMARREFNRIVKEAWGELGVLWHRKMRPKHFTKAGAQEYGYTPRKGEGGNIGRKGFAKSYTGRKLRRFGHARPLEYSGETKALTRVRDVRATSKGARVVMRANKLNFRNPHSRINMRREMTTVSKKEERHLVEVFNGVIEGKLRAMRTVKVVRAS